jgi:tetratricopeptide (TPR) repeat protein
MNQIRVILLLLIIFGSYFVSIASESSNLVDEAWKAWEQNDHATVEQKFQAAIKADPKNTRAYIGLAFLYEIQRKEKQSWEAFRNVMASEQDATPYLYAEWVTAKINLLQQTNPGVLEMMEKISQKGDKEGILRAMAHEVLGNIYQRKGQLAKAKEHYQAIGAFENWSIIGPFENISASGFNAVYPPEVEFDTKKEYIGKNNVPTKWFVPPTIKLDKWLDFQSYFGDRQSMLYANTFVFSPKKQTVSVRVGTSGSLKTFLNDVEIIRDSLETNNDFDTYIVETELQEGWNRLLVKVGSSELERCNFLARITDPRGEPIAGLKSTNEPQQYQKVSPAFVRTIPLYATEFFKKKIGENPSHIENYIMLADCYLRNDQAIEAELVLRKAQKLSPNCGLIYKYFLDAYSRGRKRDELITTYEKMVALGKDLIDALQYKYSQYLENEDYDRAEEILNKLEKLQPESESVLSLRLELYGKKKLTEKVIQLAKEGYEKFPTNWRYVNLACTIDYQLTRKQDGTIDILKKFLEKDYSDGVLSYLAKAYLEASKIDDWEKTYQKMLEYSPASPGYYYQMANVFTTLQKYDRAAAMMDKALAFCPSCGAYWAKLGDVQRSKKNIPDAKESYKKALQFIPTDYDSRDILRELDGKKSIFTTLGEGNIDSLVKAAPKAEQQPEATAAIILDKSTRVVYPQGASETSQELLVRLFNDKGIDRFKEYYLGFNSYSQSLIIEKAVTIKSDGSEIRGDINKNHIVFKSLEKNDFIYIKWHIRNYNTGKLAKHFWDEFYFNGYYPVKNAEFSLLIPNGMDFHYQAQNLTIEPTVTPTQDGQFFTWKMRNQEGIVYEADMLDLDEIGKMVRISSIPNWNYLVDWYTELAQTKAQSTYEIQEKVQELMPNPSALTKEQKIKTIYDYITENIRYSSVSFRQSGLIPQKARDVLVNKIGDCKDVATLGIAMLREVGIPANYVLVNSGDEEQRNNIPPSIEFNHCIVAVDNGANPPTFLDLTANNHPVGSIPTMDRAAFSLVIKPGSSKPITLPRVQAAAPNMIAKTTLTLDESNSAIIANATEYTGVLTATLRARFRNKSQAEREKSMQSELSSEFPSVKLTKFDVSSLENLAPSVTYSYTCNIPNYMTDAGDFKLVKIPWRDDLRADDALAYEHRIYPMKYRSGVDTSYEEMDIKLPEDFEPLDVPKSKKLTSPIAEYSVDYSFSGSVLKAKRVFIHKKTLVDTTQYDDFKKFYNTVVKEDAKQILLKKK